MLDPYVLFCLWGPMEGHRLHIFGNISSCFLEHKLESTRALFDSIPGLLVVLCAASSELSEVSLLVLGQTKCDSNHKD